MKYMMYKIINKHVPQYLTNKFNIVNSGYALRIITLP